MASHQINHPTQIFGPVYNGNMKNFKYILALTWVILNAVFILSLSTLPKEVTGTCYAQVQPDGTSCTTIKQYGWPEPLFTKESSANSKLEFRSNNIADNASVYVLTLISTVASIVVLRKILKKSAHIRN